MNGWSKPFPLGSLYRFDLQRIGYTNQQIDELTCKASSGSIWNQQPVVFCHKRRNRVASKNPYAKTVKPEQAHFVYQSFDGAWTWYVLKTYQTPEKEVQNPYARWFCMVTSPYTSTRGDWGDVYVAEIKRQAPKLDYNPFYMDKQTLRGEDE